MFSPSCNNGTARESFSSRLSRRTISAFGTEVTTPFLNSTSIVACRRADRRVIRQALDRSKRVHHGNVEVGHAVKRATRVLGCPAAVVPAYQPARDCRPFLTPRSR